jgi:membrane-bound lytic murein transglycosylase B
MVFPLVMKEGTEYWLGFDNFFVITRYNRAIHYAMAVFELAREIRAARPGSTAAP